MNLVEPKLPKAATKAVAKAPIARRSTRQERAESLRLKILAAAAKVVGEHGYAEASIGRITESADIAQGTFYLYFESRQALFDVLLPHVGLDMVHFIGRKVKGAGSFYAVEEQGFRAFFEYLRLNPGFFRVLNEAEVAAPVAHAAHMKLLAERHVKSLQRSIDQGDIRNFEPQELETLAYLLQAARSYLYLCHIKGKSLKKLPDWVVQTYMKVVRGGVN
ncbi:TetR/AcrR family transcriptional regulator [Pantoea sp. 18069]|uniref:TetR/AcrR family transcriptional regulator n=1 Tax=Pantoea sp. 18069 TaxID=2681415 RepID=UPI001358D21E|nr:TetR/AcrR family transcriptional regulator [Pantoea sp. 18069]